MKSIQHNGFFILMQPNIEYQQGNDYLIKYITITLDNNTNEILYFNYVFYIQNQIFFQSNNIQLGAHTALPIHDFPFEKWESNSFITIKFSQLQQDVVGASIQFQLKPKLFFKQLDKAMLETQTPVLRFKQFDHLQDIIITTDDLTPIYHVRQVNDKHKIQKFDLLPSVVDLHIEKIMPNYSLNKHEILHYQIHYFCNIIDKALKQGMDKIIIIHGVGEGILKQAIHDELNGQYKLFVLKFANEYHPQYGFGSTEIYFK